MKPKHTRILLFFIAVGAIKIIFAVLAVSNYWALWETEDIARISYYDGWAFQPFLLKIRYNWLPLPVMVFGLLVKIFGHPYITVVIFQSFISILCCFLIFSLTRSVCDLHAAYAAAIACLILPISMKLGTGALAEPMLFAAMLFTLIHFVHFSQTGSKRSLTLFCIGTAITQLVRYEGWGFTFAVSAVLSLIIIAKKDKFSVR